MRRRRDLVWYYKWILWGARAKWEWEGSESWRDFWGERLMERGWGMRGFAWSLGISAMMDLYYPSVWRGCFNYYLWFENVYSIRSLKSRFWRVHWLTPNCVYFSISWYEISSNWKFDTHIIFCQGQARGLLQYSFLKFLKLSHGSSRIVHCGYSWACIRDINFCFKGGTWSFVVPRQRNSI